MDHIVHAPFVSHAFLSVLRRPLSHHLISPSLRFYPSSAESNQKKAQDMLASAQKNASKLSENSKTRGPRDLNAKPGV